MTATHSQSRTLFNNLAVLLTGQLFLPEDATYEQSVLGVQADQIERARFYMEPV